MASFLLIRSGSGDRGGDGDNTFSGNSSGLIGQVLAGDSTPTTIFQSEFQGLSASTPVVIQVDNSIDTSSIDPYKITFLTLNGGGGGNISFIADFDNNGGGGYFGKNTILEARGRRFSISGRGVETNAINTFTDLDAGVTDGAAISINSSSFINSGNLTSYSRTQTGNNGNGGAIALNSSGNISTSSLSSFSEVNDTGNTGNGGAISLNTSGNISTFNLSSYSKTIRGNAGNGGAISLNTSGNISTFNLSSYSLIIREGNVGNGGAITLNSSGNITAFNLNSSSGTVSSTSGSTSGNVGNGGAITLNSSGNITASTLDSSAGTSFGNVGNGGAITLNSSGNINVTRLLDSSAVTRTGNAGNGGSITLNSLGNISTSTLFSYSEAERDNAGNGGSITLNSSGNIRIEGSIFSFSQVKRGSTGNIGNAGSGGAISIAAANSLDLDFINNITSESVNYGNITLTGNEINLTGEINSVRGNNKNLILQSTTPSQIIEIGADSGNVSVLDITARDLEAIADGFSQITIGRSNGTGAINIKSNVTFSDPIFLQSSGQVNINGTVSLVGDSNLNFSSSLPVQLNAGGTILIGANEQINNNADFNLNGGTLNANGFNETLDLLRVTGNSTIDFGNSSSDIAFSNSSNQAWTGNLTINNWSNALGETLRFGSDASGLNASQLSRIQFSGFKIGSIIDSLGFINPINIPAVNLSLSSNSGSEPGTIVITASASSAVSGNQTVNIAVAGLGITTEDYNLSSNVITILNGQATGSVTFTVTDDALVEGTETAVLTISNPSSGIILGSTTTQNIAIKDNDFPAVNLSVSSSSGTEEGTTAITVTITAANAVEGNQTVNLAVAGSGINIGDYSLSNSVITILNGQTIGSVTFTVTDDALVEGTENAVLTISNPSSGLVLGSTTTQSVVIKDNDFPAVNLSVSSSSGTEAETTAITVTITAANAVEGNQTVNLNVTGEGITAGDFNLSNNVITIPSGQTTGTVTFTIAKETLVEGLETAILSISNPSSGLVLGSTVSQNIVITENNKIFSSWSELVAEVSSQIGRPLTELESILKNKLGDLFFPVNLESAKAEQIVISYLGNLDTSKLLNALSGTDLKLPSSIPLLINPQIEVNGQSLNNPTFNLTIPSTNVLEVLKQFRPPDFVKNILTELKNLKLTFGKDLIELTYLGDFDISASINKIAKDLGLGTPLITPLPVTNLSIRVKEFTSDPKFEVGVAGLPLKELISILGNLAGGKLPDEVLVTLQSIGEDLTKLEFNLSDKQVTIRYQDKLNFSINLNDLVSGSPDIVREAISKIIAEFFPESSSPNLSVSIENPAISVATGPEVGLAAKLNGSNINVTYDKEKDLKLSYQLPNVVDFSKLAANIPILSTFKLSDSEVIISSEAKRIEDPKLGSIDIIKGFNLKGNIDFQSNTDTDKFSNFIFNKLGIKSLGSLVGLGSSGANLTAVVPLMIDLFNFGDGKIKAELNNLILSLKVGTGEPAFGFKGGLRLSGYDPFQKNEPILLLSGLIGLEPESVTIGYALESGSDPWDKPFGIPGTQIRNLALQVGATYIAPFLDNIGFLGDFRFGNFDLKTALAIDLNDPDKIALVLTANQPITLVDLLTGPVGSFALKQVGNEIPINE